MPTNARLSPFCSERPRNVGGSHNTITSDFDKQGDSAYVRRIVQSSTDIEIFIAFTATARNRDRGQPVDIVGGAIDTQCAF